MLIRKEHTHNNGLLGIWHITETKEDLLCLFPDNSREKACSYIAAIKSEKRVLEWLSTRLMMHLLLDDDEKVVLHTKNGKPYVSDNSHKISISHTNNYAAILLHETLDVGIDIETHTDRVKKLANKFISEKEYIDESQKVVHQLLHWSAKETAFKLIHEAEIDFREHLYLQPFTPQQRGVIEVLETRTNRQQTYRLQYEVHANYVLTWGFSE